MEYRVEIVPTLKKLFQELLDELSEDRWRICSMNDSYIVFERER